METQDDGTVIVYGKATSDDIDLDDQIIDRDFAEKGLQEWFENWGNVRQMHSTHLPPGGRAMELEKKDDGVWLKSHIVEPSAVNLVKNGVYRGYSVGISRPRIVRDKAARNGRVIDGVFTEVSLVDRPANPSCKMAVFKRAQDGSTLYDGEPIALDDEGVELAKTFGVELTKGSVLPAHAPDRPMNPQDPNAVNADPKALSPHTDSYGHSHLHFDGTRHSHVHKHVQGEETHDTTGHGHGSLTMTTTQHPHPDPQNPVQKSDVDLLAAASRDYYDQILDRPRDAYALVKSIDPSVGGGVDRSKLKASDFVFPKTRTFPIVTPGDVSDAVSSWGRYKGGESFASFKSQLTALCRRKGSAFVKALPDSWNVSKMESERTQELTKTLRNLTEGLVKSLAVGDEETSRSTISLGRHLLDEFLEVNEDQATDVVLLKLQGQLDDAEAFLDKLDSEGWGGRDTVTKGVKKALQKVVDHTVEVSTEDLEKAATPPGDDAGDDDDENAGAKCPLCKGTGKIDEGNRKCPKCKGTGKMEKAEMPLVPLMWKRLHDATCCAYPDEVVKTTHPAVLTTSLPELAKGVLEDLEGRLPDADPDALPYIAQGVSFLRRFVSHDPDELTMASEGLRKAFEQDYPNTHLTPSAPPNPGKFKRPYLTAGRPPMTGHTTQAKMPTGGGNVNAGQFDRSGLHGEENPAPGFMQVKKGRVFYSNEAKGNAQAALALVHDYLASTFPQMCPTGVPGGGDDNVPLGNPAPEGLGDVQHLHQTGGATFARPTGAGLVSKSKKIKKKAKKDKNVIKRSDLKAIIKSATKSQAELIASLQDRLEKMESEPDPAQAPVRGSVVALRALAESKAREEQEDLVVKRARQARVEEMEYLQRASHSGNPEIRMQAQRRLEELLGENSAS